MAPHHSHRGHLHAVQVSGPLLAAPTALKLLPKRPEWSKCRNRMILQHETKYLCVFRVDCQESSSGSLRWLAIYNKSELATCAKNTCHHGTRHSRPCWGQNIRQSLDATPIVPRPRMCCHGPNVIEGTHSLPAIAWYVATDLPRPIQQ